MELYILSADIFLITGISSRFICDLSLFHNLQAREALYKKYSPQSLLIIDTRLNLDKSFYRSLSKKEIAVIFVMGCNSTIAPRFVYAENSVNHKVFYMRNKTSKHLFNILGVVFKSYRFTEKECNLLYYILEGRTISDLCQINKIGKETYHSHLSNILLKVGCDKVFHLYQYKQFIYYEIMCSLRPSETRRSKNLLWIT
ncbi:TPA: hypothetical protein MBI14_005238 [Klebsiella pneumoniae]|nr:hypothetical protein [Klebsiella pneumoniae]